MNILRNFEAVFVVALGLASAASYTLDNNTPASTPAMAAASNMQVVVIKGHRADAVAAQQTGTQAALAARSASVSKI